jgi:hypothetical protein
LTAQFVETASRYDSFARSVTYNDKWSNAIDLEFVMTQLSYDVELYPGDTLQLPESVVRQVGPGRWRIIIEAIDEESTSFARGHSAFLNGYAPDDEGLYDDYPTR